MKSPAACFSSSKADIKFQLLSVWTWSVQKRSMKDEEFVVWICRHGQHEKEETVCLWRMLKCPSLCPTSDHLYSFSLWGSADQKNHKEFFIKLKLWCCPVKFITQQNRTSSDKHTSSCCCVFVFFMFLPTASKCLLQDRRRSRFWRPVGSGRTESSFSWTQISREMVIKSTFWMKVKGLIVGRDAALPVVFFQLRPSTCNLQTLRCKCFKLL